MRVHGPADGPAVVCVNGGQAAAVEGTWSASLEWLVGRLAPRFPQLRFGEVRYRIKSWNRFDLCVEDARAAIAQSSTPSARSCSASRWAAPSRSRSPTTRASRACSASRRGSPTGSRVEPLRGRRLDVLHGSLDRPLPGIPGVSPANSRRGFERAQALGVPGTYTLLRGAVHAIAVRAGRPVPLPRAGTWARHVAAHLDAFTSPRVA